ncbi:hypothetical protein C8F04DRAFT_1195526 [Mycena alexandri]|uniref:Transposase n=1 Tax=Mycena alexandri TaxID=1745969 RepID=A0AAD6WUF8_9AGAR|nr:hypothetical protein C8F04DRAFT_1195526 [Mycena alexandri]
MYDGRRGKSGRKPTFSGEQLKEAEESLESGELIDGEDVRREMFPEVPARTNWTEGLCTAKKPNLTQRHIAQRKQMYEQYETWTNGDIFLRGMGSGMFDATADTMPWRLTAMEAHGCKNIKVNVWGALHPMGVSKLIRIDGILDAELYVQILEHAMIPIYDHLENRCHTFLVFQQDNGPKHTSRCKVLVIE